MNEDGTLAFSKSGFVDFTLMFSIVNIGDIYVQVSVANVLDNNYDIRFGQTIRKMNDDHASITSRRIIHVNAGDKFALVYKITDWSTIHDNGAVNSNGHFKSTGLMAQYVSYDS